MHEIQLDIVTPNKKVLSTLCTDAIIPCYDGEMGILDMHENFVTLLGIGIASIHTKNGIEKILIRSGFVEIANNTITLLADEALSVQDIEKEKLILKQKNFDDAPPQLDDPTWLETKQWLDLQQTMIEQ